MADHPALGNAAAEVANCCELVTPVVSIRPVLQMPEPVTIMAPQIYVRQITAEVNARPNRARPLSVVLGQGTGA